MQPSLVGRSGSGLVRVFFFSFFYTANTHCPATPLTTPKLSEGSLNPSDSISQTLYSNISGASAPPPHPPPTQLVPRPLTRPAHLPQSVLWTYEDCQNDSLVGLTASNKSRPPMHRVIRLENGCGIPFSQWKSIRASACAIARSTLGSLVSKDPRAATRVRKKKYFKMFFPKEWEVATTQLEAAAPLLALCAGNWKADLTLGVVLSTESVLPSGSPLSVSSSQSHTSLPPPLRSEQATSGSLTRKALAGNKSKRARDPSPPRQLSKKAKCVGHRGEDKEASGAGEGAYAPPSIISNTDHVAGVSKDQSVPSPPDFLAIVRSAAPSQPRARPKVNYKGITVRPSGTSPSTVLRHLSNFSFFLFTQSTI